MDEMPSAQFRKVYAKLRNPTAVTVNGHVIGRWLPGAGPATSWLDRETATEERAASISRDAATQVDSFSRYRPAPKPGRK